MQRKYLVVESSFDHKYGIMVQEMGSGRVAALLPYTRDREAVAVLVDRLNQQQTDIDEFLCLAIGFH